MIIATTLRYVGDACGPPVAELGHEFFKVADVPGLQDYPFLELKARRRR